jgi:hypothetical protein
LPYGSSQLVLAEGQAASLQGPREPPASRAHLSQAERQRKIVVGSWITFAGACMFLVGGFVICWLENSN